MKCPRCLIVLASCVLGAASCGCFGPKVKNGPLERHDPQAGYRFETLKPGSGNTDEVFVVLCFSGGGTRAAALSYGVLKELRDAHIAGTAAGDAPRRMLDEVDVITSVSGGSFTSMAYGLDRDDMFGGAFERRFLKQNIQSRLARMVLRPRNLLLIPYALLDRIDLAADYYDRYVFDRRTYQSLLDRGDRPFIVVNATNMSIGERFEFTQGDFDLLGSDLSTLPVGHAVAASSAFPLLLSPLRLKYYPGPAQTAALEEVLGARDTKITADRRYKWAASLEPEDEPAATPEVRFDEKNHRFLYLLDGGLVDNLGITYVTHELRFGHLRRLIEAGKVRRMVVIIVDANVDRPQPIEGKSSAPGMFTMAMQTGTTSMYQFSETLTGIFRYFFREHVRNQRAMYESYQKALEETCPGAPPLPPPPLLLIEPYLVEVNLHAVPDLRARKRFLNMPTSFFLVPGDVEALVEMGGKLLRDNPEYQRLLRDLGGQADVPPPKD